MNRTVVTITYTVIAPQPKRQVSTWRVLAPSIVLGLSLSLLVISLLQIFVVR